MAARGGRKPRQSPRAKPVAAAAAEIEVRLRPLVTAALVGGLTGAALTGIAIMGGRLLRRRDSKPADPPA